MASIDNQSVRDEFERIKSEFTTLTGNKKMSPESVTLVNGLILLFELILSIFLEKNTKKTTLNSSKPSSQTEKDESAVGKQGSKGKGKTETSATATNTRTVESITVLPVHSCDSCGESLRKVTSECFERRTRIDIVFEKTVEHMDAEIKHCPACDATVKSRYPSDMQGPLQYGNGLKAYVIQLIITQMVALNRVQKMLATLNDEACSGLQKRYRNILTRGKKELPPLLKKPTGRRGRIAKSDAHTLWERLYKHEKSVLLFARDPHVAFTNNRAERDLRMSKVKQKVSGCFRVQKYAEAYCRISSCLQTMANEGVNPMVAIQMALTGTSS